MLNYLNALCASASMRLAVAGDGNGNVIISGRPNFMYARLGGNDGDVIEVRATIRNESSGALAEGDAVYVMLENPAAPGAWRAVFRLR